MLRFSLHKMSNCLSFGAGISHNHPHFCAINQAFKYWWLGSHLKQGSRATMHWGNSLFASLLLRVQLLCVCSCLCMCVFCLRTCVVNCAYVCGEEIRWGCGLAFLSSTSFFSLWHVKRCSEAYRAYLRAKTNETAFTFLCVHVWSGSHMVCTGKAGKKVTGTNLKI